MTIIMVWMVATPYWVKDLRLVANRMVPTRLKLISLAEFVDMISLMICAKEGGGMGKRPRRYMRLYGSCRIVSSVFGVSSW